MICEERAAACAVPKVTHNVFVYGTLRPADAKGKILPATHMLLGYQMWLVKGNFEFPAIKETGEGYVMGNIISVDDDRLKELDRYENIRSGLYKRVEVEILPIGGDGHYHLEEPKMKAFVYAADTALPSLIPSGDWTTR